MRLVAFISVTDLSKAIICLKQKVLPFMVILIKNVRQFIGIVSCHFLPAVKCYILHL